MYEGSDGAPELQRAIERCDELKEFFRAVDDCRREPLRTPEDVNNVIQLLNALDEKNTSTVSDTQRSEVLSAVDKIRQRVAAEEKKAIDWLEDLERAEKSGTDPVKLANSLKCPPSFLPEGSADRLVMLTRQVNVRIDEDQILVVVTDFEKIKDISKRRACLDRLTTLMERD